MDLVDLVGQLNHYPLAIPEWWDERMNGANPPGPVSGPAYHAISERADPVLLRILRFSLGMLKSDK